MTDIKTVGAFTPGPWEVLNSTSVFSALGADSGDGTKADSTDGWTICDCRTGVTFVDGTCVELGHDVQKANAKLIAAAPDLLEALEGMISLFPDGVEDGGSGVGFTESLKAKYRAANKAVAKARGES